MKSYKSLFSRAIAASPGRLHFAAHSHHLWPDASYDGHMEAWNDAAALADRKWEKIFGDVVPRAQRHIAAELNLPDPNAIGFAPNTHELLVRLFSKQRPRPAGHAPMLVKWLPGVDLHHDVPFNRRACCFDITGEWFLRLELHQVLPLIGRMLS